jgi:hypothetical protein
LKKMADLSGAYHKVMHALRLYENPNSRMMEFRERLTNSVSRLPQETSEGYETPGTYSAFERLCDALYRLPGITRRGLIRTSGAIGAGVIGYKFGSHIDTVLSQSVGSSIEWLDVAPDLSGLVENTNQYGEVTSVRLKNTVIQNPNGSTSTRRELDPSGETDLTTILENAEYSDKAKYENGALNVILKRHSTTIDHFGGIYGLGAIAIQLNGGLTDSRYILQETNVEGELRNGVPPIELHKFMGTLYALVSYLEIGNEGGPRYYRLLRFDGNFWVNDTPDLIKVGIAATAQQLQQWQQQSNSSNASSDSATEVAGVSTPSAQVGQEPVIEGPAPQKTEEPPKRPEDPKPTEDPGPGGGDGGGCDDGMPCP